MKRYILLMALFTCSSLTAEDDGLDAAPARPNRFMQALAACATWPRIALSFCYRPEVNDRDPRDSSTLYRDHVASFELRDDYEENNCCAITWFCVPCCVPQQSRVDDD